MYPLPSSFPDWTEPESAVRTDLVPEHEKRGLAFLPAPYELPLF